MKSGAILVLMLLAASTAEAAHRPRHAPVRRTCDPQTTTLKQFKRTPHSFGGPVAMPSQRLLVGLTDPTTRVTRATETDDDDDASAIQNDAPAAQADLETRGAPVLIPLGLLAGPIDSRLHTVTFSPRSPRGPPIAL